MAEATRQVLIVCFHDELCQVFNSLMTALSLLRQGAKVTVFCGHAGGLEPELLIRKAPPILPELPYKGAT